MKIRYFAFATNTKMTKIIVKRNIKQKWIEMTKTENINIIIVIIIKS